MKQWLKFVLVIGFVIFSCVAAMAAEEEIDGITPDDNPDEYCVRGDDQCANLIPMCDDLGGGNVSITINGVCNNAVRRIDYLGNAGEFFIIAKKDGDSKTSTDGKEVTYKFTKNDGKSNPPTFGEFYANLSAAVKTFVKSWGEASGNDALIKRANIPNAANNKELQKKVYGKDGKEHPYLNTKYASSDEAIKDGAVQVIKQNGKEIPERIIDPTSPFAAEDQRHVKGVWKEMPLYTVFGSKNSTQLCGKDSLEGGKKSWQGGTGKGAVEDYGYYSESMGKGGKIYTIPKRSSEYQAKYNSIYWPCYIPCAAGGGSAAICKLKCHKKAAYRSCRANILPAVKMLNPLKVGHTSDGESGMSSFTKTKGKSVDQKTAGDGMGSGSKGYIGHGTTIGNVDPEVFGYNMPTVLDVVTGKSFSSVAKGSSKSWKPSSKTIVGPNSRMKSDESNPADVGVNGGSCNFGGWNEVVQYQANCQRIHGVNGMCDYFKNFWRGSAIGYALYRVSGQYSLSNDSNSKSQQATFDNFKYDKAVKNDNVATLERRLPIEGGNYPAIIGKKIAGKAGESASSASLFPGKGKFAFQGLDNAKVGDIIIWDYQGKSASPEVVNKRPFHAAVVEKVIKDSKNTCIEISESNNGVIRDACYNTENWGRVTTRTLCKNDDAKYPFKFKGKAGLRTCAFTQLAKCREYDWDKWKVYRFTEDDRAFDPKTGAAKDGAQCKQLQQEFDKAQDKVKAKQTGGWEAAKNKNNKPDEDVKNAKDALKKLQDYGCNPSAKNVIQSRNLRAGSITTAQYTPAAPGEPVSNRDSLYMDKSGGFFALPKVNINAVLSDITSKPNNKGDNSAGTNDADANKSCGTIAVEVIEQLKKDTAKGGYSYKDDCAGDKAAPNKSGTKCNGKEYGRFGLVQKAYNNDRQTVNVNGFWFTAPAHADGNSAEVIAYRNTYDNKYKEPNGCRLTNLASCAKDGDVVMVQYGNGLNRLTNYNRWLVYSKNSFYEVQENGNLIRYGSMPQEYTNSSYEVRHLSCNK